jgi:hypothetical protein
MRTILDANRRHVIDEKGERTEPIPDGSSPRELKSASQPS